MKKIYLYVVTALAISTTVKAQSSCSGRYAADVFTTITTTTAIPYGDNLDYTGTPITLTLDFYEPAGDIATARPLIILVHGGSFVGGTSTEQGIVSLSQHLAKKGYVCASINYRLGVSPFDSTGMIRSVIRAVQDLKATIRFFYKDRLTTNTYKIDTTNIFIGGGSAGSVTALHAAYLKRSCQILPYISQVVLDALGGLDGYSGNQCYSQNVKGVIDISGALGVYAWLEGGDVPLCSMHGTTDNVVPYSRGIVNPGIPIMYADGSRMIYQQAQVVGVQDNFYTFQGAGHVPMQGTTTAELAYMDTTVNFIRDFLLQRMGITCPLAQTVAPYGNPVGTATLYSYTNCTTNAPLSCSAVGIKSISNNLLLELYPNPSNDKIKIVFENGAVNHAIQITDISGRVLKSYTTNQPDFIIEKGDLNTGMYLLKVSNAHGESSLQKIMFY